MPDIGASRRVLVVSSDGHVGSPVAGYRDYVETRYRGDFDDWLARYVPQWTATELKNADLQETLSETYKREWLQIGKTAQFAAAGTCDPQVRLAAMDSDGVAVDILFPDDQSSNTPPFFGFTREFDRPWQDEYSPELKLAGARAYNRWLADFCSAAPDRLLGLATLGSLADVEAAVAEVIRAKESGLKGVLLPLVYYNIHEPFVNDPRYDPLWATCAELEMPVHTHNGGGSPYYGTGPDAPILFGIECTLWPHRPLWFMTMSGVFERHPNLKLVLSEQGIDWIPWALMVMDAMSMDRKFAYHATKTIKLKPSEYFQRQCWLGASILRRGEVEQRHAIGIDKIMWGWDFPHIESADWLAPKDSIRQVMGDLPEDEIRAMLAGNAVAAYGLDAAALLPVADRIGPTLRELAEA
ncbi:MAG: amidohydrolase family protein [Novosphingobium sp.]|nr:amidohydrolase family protein [Novosphingobium sp.]